MLCAGSTSTSAIDNLRSTFNSYWIDNLGFILRENLLLHSSYLPLGVSQRACVSRAIKLFFWRRCRGEEVLLEGLALPTRRHQQFSSAVAGELEVLWIQQTTVSLPSSAISWRREHQACCKGSLSLPTFFTLLLSCLVYFYFVLFASFIKNTKKNSYLFLSCYFESC